MSQVVNGIYQCGLYRIGKRKIFLISDPHTPVKSPNSFDLIKDFLDQNSLFDIYLEETPFELVEKLREDFLISDCPLADLCQYLKNRKVKNRIIKYDLRQLEINYDIDQSRSGILFGIFENANSLEEVFEILSHHRITSSLDPTITRKIERFHQHVNQMLINQDGPRFDRLLKKSRLTRDEKEFFHYCLKEAYAHLIDVYLLTKWWSLSTEWSVVIGGTSHIWFLGEYFHNIADETLFEVLHNENYDPIRIPKLWK